MLYQNSTSAFVLESVTFVAPSWSLSSEAPTSFLLSPDNSVAFVLSPEASVAFLLPRKLHYSSCGPSSSGCSVATESCQRCESCHFSYTSVTDAVRMSKQTPCFPLRKTIPFTSITNVCHFNRAPQNHGHKAHFWVAQGALVYWPGPGEVGQGGCQGFQGSLLPSQLLSWLLEVTQCSGRHRVPEPDGFFARSFYYLCCRRNTYSFKFNFRFLLHLG